ncbi:hypothetical protein L211DRAFT_707129 [Terfezia boudieri ATCC MYA-4762]|uniref:Uncharacterized protein n=1 Tax=Terfezia boudieri ATCC MYA-4762 TaxID=1051890 RepID=A0A3N4M046_9PEZI|nr:hypothetical protein L211DRAFT_707129 [Terfezia boudieri ATCC MYA-4762]
MLSRSLRCTPAGGFLSSVACRVKAIQHVQAQANPSNDQPCNRTQDDMFLLCCILHIRVSSAYTATCKSAIHQSPQRMRQPRSESKFPIISLLGPPLVTFHPSTTQQIAYPVRFASQRSTIAHLLVYSGTTAIEPSFAVV